MQKNDADRAKAAAFTRWKLRPQFGGQTESAKKLEAVIDYAANCG